jgi:hypothetical protein
MRMLVKRYPKADGDFAAGSVRIAVVTEPTGRCLACGVPLYPSVVFGPSGTMSMARDMGAHKRACSNGGGRVVRRTVTLPAGVP